MTGVVSSFEFNAPLSEGGSSVAGVPELAASGDRNDGDESKAGVGGL